MDICGIICEFNPFHHGHAYLLRAVRERLGDDCGIVCAMSGDFVQRGEAAAFAKHDRAAAAVACGADLVLELPLPWCTAGAETFARGGVGLLAATGLVTHLTFGSESGDMEGLRQTAEILDDPAMDQELREGLETGISYAAARQQAAEHLAGKSLPMLRTPNDILALEYLRALRHSGAGIEPFAVRRVGAGHDSLAAGPVYSAAAAREVLWAGGEVGGLLPGPSYAALMSGAGPVAREQIETALLSRLRFLPEATFAAAPDAGAGEGFYRRVYEAARTAPELVAIPEAAATRRYPRARVRRLCLGAALGLRAGDAAGTPPYLRVLAANGRGRELLRRMEATSLLPLVTRPVTVRTLDARAQRIFTLGAQAADLLSLGYANVAQRAGDRDWRSGPVIVK